MILQELTLSGLAKRSSNFTSLFPPFFAVMYRSGILDLFTKLSRSLFRFAFFSARFTKESMSRFVCF